MGKKHHSSRITTENNFTKKHKSHHQKHKILKSIGKSTKKVSHGAVKRIDSVGKFYGSQVNKMTDTIQGITSSPFFLPVIGICGVGVILVMTK